MHRSRIPDALIAAGLLSVGGLWAGCQSFMKDTMHDMVVTAVQELKGHESDAPRSSNDPWYLIGATLGIIGHRYWYHRRRRRSSPGV